MQAAIYLTVQLLAYGLDMGTFVLLHSYGGADTFLSNIAAKIVAGCFAFFSHRNITFATHEQGSLGSQALRYVLLLMANSFASSALLALFLLVTPNAVVAKIIADTILIGLSFVLSKSIVFTNSGRARHDREV